MIKKSILSKAICVILIIAFSFENVLWANPEVFKKKTASNTLQAWSKFDDSPSEFRLEATCKYIVGEIPDLEKLDGPIVWVKDGRIFSVDGTPRVGDDAIGKYDDEHNWFIPCSISTSSGVWRGELVLGKNSDASDEKPVSLRERKRDKRELQVEDIERLCDKEFKPQSSAEHFDEAGEFTTASTSDTLLTLEYMHSLNPNARICDLGSGNGKFCFLARRKFNSVAGIELREYLDNAARHIQSLLSQISPEAGDIEFMQGDFFKENLSSYDILTFFYTLPGQYGTSENFHKALREKMLSPTGLKPGGKLIVVCGGTVISDDEELSHELVWLKTTAFSVYTRSAKPAAPKESLEAEPIETDEKDPDSATVSEDDDSLENTSPAPVGMLSVWSGTISKLRKWHISDRWIAGILGFLEEAFFSYVVVHGIAAICSWLGFEYHIGISVGTIVSLGFFLALKHPYHYNKDGDLEPSSSDRLWQLKVIDKIDIGFLAFPLRLLYLPIALLAPNPILLLTGLVIISALHGFYNAVIAYHLGSAVAMVDGDGNKPKKRARVIGYYEDNIKILISKRRINEARSLLRRLLSIDSTNSWARATLNELSPKKGSPREIAKLRKEIESLGDRARKLARNKLYDEAEDLLLQILDINPEAVTALSALAQLYQEANKPEKAVEYANRYLAKRPVSPRPAVIGAKVKALVDLGRRDDAIEVYDSVLRTDPKNISIWKSKIKTLIAIGENERAEEVCDEALRLNPGNKAIRNLRTEIVTLHGSDDAKDKNLPPVDKRKQIDLLIREADQHIQIGQYEAAKASLFKILSVDPKVAVALGALVRVCQGMNNPREALHYAELYLLKRSKSPRPTVLMAMAEAHVALGEGEEALKVYDRVLAIEPDNEMAFEAQKALSYTTGSHKVAEKEPTPKEPPPVLPKIDGRSVYEVVGTLIDHERYVIAMRICDKYMPLNLRDREIRRLRARALLLEIARKSFLQGRESTFEFMREQLEISRGDKELWALSTFVLYEFERRKLKKEVNIVPQTDDAEALKCAIRDNLAKKAKNQDDSGTATYFTDHFTEEDITTVLKLGLENVQSITDFPLGDKLDWWPRNRFVSYVDYKGSTYRLEIICDESGKILTIRPTFGKHIYCWKSAKGLSVKTQPIFKIPPKLWNRHDENSMNLLVGEKGQGFTEIFNDPILAWLKPIDRERLILLAAVEGKPYTKKSGFTYYAYDIPFAFWRDKLRCGTIYLKKADESPRDIVKVQRFAPKGGEPPAGPSKAIISTLLVILGGIGAIAGAVVYNQTEINRFIESIAHNLPPISGMGLALVLFSFGFFIWSEPYKAKHQLSESASQESDPTGFLLLSRKFLDEGKLDDAESGILSSIAINDKSLLYTREVRKSCRMCRKRNSTCP